MCCKENLCELRRQVYFHICSYKRPSIYNVILDMRGGPNILQYYLAPCSQPCAVGISFGRSKFTNVKLCENLHSWLDGSGGSCGSVASDGSGWSGGLMSLLGLFGLVDLVCQLVWYFLAILLHPKGFSNGSIVQNEYPNELDDPQVFVGLKSFQMKAWTP